MKPIRFIVALVLLANSHTLFAQPKPKARKLALLVGVNNYEGTGLGSLNHTVRDMEALEKALKDVGFEVQILKNREATKTAITAKLKELNERRAIGDLTLIAMSGHGVQMSNEKGEEDAFYCPAECDKSNAATLLSLTSLVQSLGKKGVNLVLVDACRDDPRKGFRGIQGNELQDRLPANTAILFSCSARQQSFETNRMFGENSPNGHGVFFYQVLQGLGGAAKDADGEVTWDTLVNYVKKTVNVKAKEWFDDRAKQLATDQGIELDSLKFQTPHALSNLQDSPVLARASAVPAAPPNPMSATKVIARFDLTGGYNMLHFGNGKLRVLWCNNSFDSKIHIARVYDADSGDPVTKPMKHDRDVVQAAFSSDGARIVTASEDKTARVWDATTGEALTPSCKHDDCVNHAAFSLDGSRIVTASDDKTARVWDAKTGEPISPPLKHDQKVFQAAFSPDGSWVVTASLDGTARVWNAKTGKPLTALETFSTVTHAAFSPDGSQIVTASISATVWNAKNFERLNPTLKHDFGVRFVAFSLDGSRIVTASSDNTARVWDAKTGAFLTPPLKHDEDVSHAVFCPDGSRIVTASIDNTARVWDAKTGEPLTSPLKHPAWVRLATFSPDGSRVVTAADDNTARVWDAKTGELLKAITISKD